ncbi:MAG: S1/P1 nuclease [Spartobacteria bacterium]
MTKAFLLASLLLIALSHPACAYGPDGHKIIGGIADRRMTGTPAGGCVSALLDGYTLEEASIMVDTIKQWDKPGINDPKVQKYFSSHPKIAEQLRAFWKANPPTTDDKSTIPSHHWFHYTDVPLMGAEKYGDGKEGRSQWDIVHMMRYCIAVLQGKEPEENKRKITKPIAVILLAHLVGDIHQPLHVGAQYFNGSGEPVNPKGGGEFYPDEGGNSLRLKLTRDAVQRKKDPKLHGFWDGDAVLLNLPQFPDTMPKEERQAKMDLADRELTDRLAKAEPKNWRLPDALPVTDYPERWANEILPLARQLHARLRYQNVTPKLDHEKMLADGEVVELPMRDGLSFSKWSARTVLEEMHLAGWRLAGLLERALRSTEAPNSPPPQPVGRASVEPGGTPRSETPADSGAP